MITSTIIHFQTGFIQSTANPFQTSPHQPLNQHKKTFTCSCWPERVSKHGQKERRRHNNKTKCISMAKKHMNRVSESQKGQSESKEADIYKQLLSPYFLVLLSLLCYCWCQAEQVIIVEDKNAHVCTTTTYV